MEQSPFEPGRPLRRGGKVLPEQARAHNRSLVLQTLFHSGGMSRADLARATALTRVSISDLVAELMDDGYVIETGERTAPRPGKPAMVVDLAHDAHRIVGIDLSGPGEFTGAVLTLSGEIVARASVPQPQGTDEHGARARVEAVVALAREMVSLSNTPVLGVGVGTPGVVDAHGVVLTAPNFGWTGIDLDGILTEALHLPVTVANDANAAVLAEYTFGGARDDVLLVKVGLGVGAGLLAGGQPLIGARHTAGEIGHVTVGTDGGPPCSCGKNGCLEAWLSVPALTARLAAVGESEREGLLRDAGERLGIALAPVVGALDLSEVVLAGPPELLGGILADQTRATLRARTLPVFHDDIRVRMTGQGPDIVLRGAAVMVLGAQLGVS